MGDINRSLGINGDGYKAKIGETEYTFMPITQKMKGSFQQTVVDDARDEAMATSAELSKRARTLRREATLKAEQAEKDKKPLSDDELEEYAEQIRHYEHLSEQQMRDFRNQKAEGAFDFTGEVCEAARRSGKGSVKMVHLMLSVRHPNLVLDDVEKLILEYPKEVRAAVREAQNLGNPKTRRDGESSSGESAMTATTETPPVEVKP